MLRSVWRRALFPGVPLALFTGQSYSLPSRSSHPSVLLRINDIIILSLSLSLSHTHSHTLTHTHTHTPGWCTHNSIVENATSGTIPTHAGHLQRQIISTAPASSSTATVRAKAIATGAGMPTCCLTLDEIDGLVDTADRAVTLRWDALDSPRGAARAAAAAADAATAGDGVQGVGRSMGWWQKGAPSVLSSFFSFRLHLSYSNSHVSQ